MRRIENAVLSLSLLSLVGALSAAPVQAQTIDRPHTNVALKNGETVEVNSIYLIGANCRSLTTATPEVEILDGPPGVTAAIKPAMITPRAFGCAKPVSGGKLYFSAKEIDDYSHSTMVVRFTYKTREGDRKRSHHYNVTLFP
ncbi:MAG: hypothetical protein K2Z80_35650 [Xanthobacteraceae bacterium]|nr:hypothetical protein [Xanthobacteraceae bacterium]